MKKSKKILLIICMFLPEIVFSRLPMQLNELKGGTEITKNTIECNILGKGTTIILLFALLYLIIDTTMVVRRKTVTHRNDDKLDSENLMGGGEKKNR